MSVESDDFLVLAEEFARGSSESMFRAAVGRSYLAALHSLHKVTDPLPKIKREKDRLGSHEEVLARLKAWQCPFIDFHAQAHLVANLLDLMQLVQLRADFVAKHELTREEAQASIERAKRVKDFAAEVLRVWGTVAA